MGDVARVVSGKAYLAFARADGKPFTVDNVGQNEKNISLGPWRLIWDNRNDPALIAAARATGHITRPTSRERATLTLR